LWEQFEQVKMADLAGRFFWQAKQFILTSLAGVSANMFTGNKW